MKLVTGPSKEFSPPKITLESWAPASVLLPIFIFAVPIAESKDFTVEIPFDSCNDPPFDEYKLIFAVASLEFPLNLITISLPTPFSLQFPFQIISLLSAEIFTSKFTSSLPFSLFVKSKYIAPLLPLLSVNETFFKSRFKSLYCENEEK